MNIKRLAILITLLLIPLALGTDYYPNTLILQGNTTASASNYTLDVAGDTGTGSISDAETFSIIGDNGVYTAMSGNVLTISKVNQTFTDTDTDSFWPINTTVLYNNSGTLTLVESWLIALINLYDTDTTYNSDEWYINEVANVFNFNEAQLNATINNILLSTTYLPFNITTSVGTYEGNETSISSLNDGDYYNVTEALANPGLTTYINFTGVVSFNQGVLYAWYEAGASGDVIDIGVWNYNTGVYDESWQEIGAGDGFILITGTVLEATNYIGTGDNEGVVQIRLNHAEQGKNTHTLHLDYIALIDGFTSVVSTQHDSLSGRDSPNNHPWAMPTDASRNFTSDVYTSGTYYGGWNGSYNYWGIFNFTLGNISTWDLAYSWGDHSTAGYLTSVEDVWLNESGDNATGVINLNAGATTTFINSTNGESYIILNSSGVFICGGC